VLNFVPPDIMVDRPLPYQETISENQTALERNAALWENARRKRARDIAALLQTRQGGGGLSIRGLGGRGGGVVMRDLGQPGFGWRGSDQMEAEIMPPDPPVYCPR